MLPEATISGQSQNPKQSHVNRISSYIDSEFSLPGFMWKGGGGSAGRDDQSRWNENTLRYYRDILGYKDAHFNDEGEIVTDSQTKRTVAKSVFESRLPDMPTFVEQEEPTSPDLRKNNSTPILSREPDKLLKPRKKGFWGGPKQKQPGKTDGQWLQYARDQLTDVDKCPVIEVKLHDIRTGKRRGWDIMTNNNGLNVTYRFTCQCSCYVGYGGNAEWSACGTSSCIHPEYDFDPTPRGSLDKKSHKGK